MSSKLKPRTKGLLAGLAVLFVGAAIVGFGTLSRVDVAETAASDMDGLFSLGAVAEMEGALHEEGAVAIAYGLGVVTDDEFAESTDYTNDAIEGIVEELSFYELDDPIGASLASLLAGVEGLDQLRSDMAEDTLTSSIADEYRALLQLTAAALLPINDRLIAPNSGEATLLALDKARQASGEAVFETTAVLLDGAPDTALAAALTALAEADDALAAASPTVAEETNVLLARSDAMLGAQGAASALAGESFDLFAWADAAVAWVLAYGDIEADQIEAGLDTMELRAESAEDAVYRYAITGSIIAVVLALLIGFGFTAIARRKSAAAVNTHVPDAAPSTN